MLTTLVLQQDYFWFLGLLAWGICAVRWWYQARTDAAWSWLPWAAGAGMALAVVEIASLVLPITPQVYVVPYRHWDLLEGGITAVMVAGWYAMAWRNGRVPPPVALIAMIVTLALAGARLYVAREVSLVLLAAALLAGAAHAMGTRRAPGWALLAVLFTVGVSATSPVAEFFLIPRRWAELDAWSFLWSALDLLVALIVWTCLRVDHARSTQPRAPRNPETRLLLSGAAGWLVLGLALAWVMSGFARRSFEDSAVSRAIQGAALFDEARLAELLNEDFRLTDVHELERMGGSVTPHATIARLTTPTGLAAAKTLSRIERANPDVSFADLGTLRDGWFLISGSNQQYGQVDGVGLLQHNDPGDQADWEAHRTGYLRPHPTRFGLKTYARAALNAPDGRMLGWLVLQFEVQRWIAAQAQARLLVFVITAFGLGLVALLALQRQGWRERESARALANSALESDRLKTAFLAKVSHELRTPIQSILGYSELLRPALGDPVARARLHALRQHTDLMLRLVNDLLDLSAIQMGAFRLRERPTCLPDLVQQAAESLRPRAESKGLDYAIEIDPQVPAWALVDLERVRQIVLNLVSNAVKFTDRGRVTVRLGRAADLDSVSLEVSDSGPGIPPEERARLFQPFARLEATAAKEGTGLGLSLASALCRSMHGQLNVRDTPGGGATFVATFRAPPCPPPESNRAEAAPATRPLAGLRVLVADDNTLVRELFAAFLQEAGAHCAAVADGEAALAAVARESFDSVVLDIAMPRLDGWETARRLRAMHSAVRIVGVSAHAGASDRARAEAEGLDAFLSKPVELDALAAALGRSARAASPTEELFARLRAQFRTEAAVQTAAVNAALDEHDLNGVRAAAHYLCNSALVVRDDALHAAVSRLEEAAQLGDPAAVARAWRDCSPLLAGWIGPAAAPAGQSSAAPSSSANPRPSA